MRGCGGEWDCYVREWVRVRVENGVLGDVEGMAFGMTVEDGGGRWWYFAFWILS